jgi:phenylacetic acid degradation operon negative regulatory protein
MIFWTQGGWSDSVRVVPTLSKNAIRAEELLILMAYGLDQLLFAYRNKDAPDYEQWLFRNGLLPRMHYLEAQKFLLRQQQKAGWVVRLTETGRIAALGGRDPQTRWDRPWDGWWRQIIFDLPMEHHHLRPSLVRWLHRNSFGYLQDSVWISPDPVTAIARQLGGFREDAASFTILECRAAPGFSNTTLVNAAWPFEKLNANYAAYEGFATEARRRLRSATTPTDILAVMREERGLWRSALGADPLLPRSLWPRRYAGESALRTRRELLQFCAARFRSGKFAEQK